MFGLFGPKKPNGNTSLLADGSFMLFGCAALLFLLLAAPLLALVIVSREGLAALASNVAGAFAGDRLWVLAVVIVAGAVVRYALVGPLTHWLAARELAQQEQVIYPPTPTIELYRGFSPAEMRQYLEANQPKAPAALPDDKPARLPGNQVTRRWLGDRPAGEQGSSPGVGWKR